MLGIIERVLFKGSVNKFEGQTVATLYHDIMYRENRELYTDNYSCENVNIFISLLLLYIYIYICIPFSIMWSSVVKYCLQVLFMQKNNLERPTVAKLS